MNPGINQYRHTRRKMRISTMAKPSLTGLNRSLGNLPEDLRENAVRHTNGRWLVEAPSNASANLAIPSADDEGFREIPTESLIEVVGS